MSESTSSAEASAWAWCDAAESELLLRFRGFWGLCGFGGSDTGRFSVGAGESCSVTSGFCSA